MRIDDNKLSQINQSQEKNHERRFSALSSELGDRGLNTDDLISRIDNLQIATPSWALNTGGTRFGRFPGKGEPVKLEEKIEDVGLLKKLSGQTGSISLHIPWDVPKDIQAVKNQAEEHGLLFDSINSNTFQDDPNGENMPKGLSYKHGSLCHSDSAVREQAVEHNLQVVDWGQQLGSKSITIWLADGSNFPGQADFRKQYENTLDSLRKIHNKLPIDFYMFTEHKPFEPNFYSSVVNDWGSSLLLAEDTGENCLCLVDLGHHLPNCNIEQVVSRLLMKNRLAGFHFNDSKYADDDLTVGSLKPYQLFLIFNELRPHIQYPAQAGKSLAWMIDASHNSKDPLEDLLQSYEAIALAYAQALLVDRDQLTKAQENNDPVLAQEILQDAYRTDTRPLIAEMRKRKGSALNPIKAYRELKVRDTLSSERA